MASEVDPISGQEQAITSFPYEQELPPAQPRKLDFEGVREERNHEEGM